MTFNTLVERVEKDFAEMPGLEVTMAQGVRLWNIGADDCRFVIDALVDLGFLNKGLGPEDAVERNPLKEYQAELGDPSTFTYGAMRSMMIAYVPD